MTGTRILFKFNLYADPLKKKMWGFVLTCRLYYKRQIPKSFKHINFLSGFLPHPHPGFIFSPLYSFLSSFLSPALFLSSSLYYFLSFFFSHPFLVSLFPFIPFRHLKLFFFSFSFFHKYFFFFFFTIPSGRRNSLRQRKN